ncbi:MAG: recombinase family protein [Myxococcota bacterium]
MILGYARVSTGGQSLDAQLDALQDAGCERVFEDRVSGVRAERPGLTQALETARAGDILVITKLDRIGRSLKHLVSLVTELAERDVGLRVLSGEIDTTSSQGRLVFHLFAALAEFERELIVERTRAGLEAARARGRLGGRPPKMTVERLRQAQTLLSNRNLAASDIAETLGVSTSTLYNYLDGKGRLKPPAVALLAKARSPKGDGE